LYIPDSGPGQRRDLEGDSGSQSGERTHRFPRTLSESGGRPGRRM